MPLKRAHFPHKKGRLVSKQNNRRSVKFKKTGENKYRPANKIITENAKTGKNGSVQSETKKNERANKSTPEKNQRKIEKRKRDRWNRGLAGNDGRPTQITNEIDEDD